MRLHQRNFSRTDDFKVDTMREFDTFFWYIEIDDLPIPARLNPVEWEAKSGKSRPARTEGRVIDKHSIIVSSGANKVTVWHSPDIMTYDDPEKQTVIKIKSKAFYKPMPSVEVMLEDVRTRGDRVHPFWGKVEL
jgi:hypothetical protein